MKFLIVLLMITQVAFAADPVDSLDNRYAAGLDKYKAEYDAKCRKLSLAYIKSLERMQVSTVKRGDLDAAMKIKGRITATRKMLKKRLPKPQVTLVAVDKDPILGTWNWFSGTVPTFRADGLVTAPNQKNKVTWERKGIKYYMYYVNGTADILTISPDGNRLDGKSTRGVKVWATRISLK